MKTCSKCGVDKDESEFYVGRKTGNLRRECKSCSCKINKEKDRKRMLKNPDVNKESSRKWRLNNPDYISPCQLDPEYSSTYRKENPEVFRESNRRYNARHRAKILARRKERHRLKYQNDLSYKLGVLLRSRLTTAVKRVKANKFLDTFSLLGCPLIWFEIHIASLFKPGMTWSNHGEVWEIDHIRPIASFDLTDPEQQRQCFHWSNQQPLFSAENNIKSDTYVTSGQSSKEIGSRCCQAPSL